MEGGAPRRLQNSLHAEARGARPSIRSARRFRKKFVLVRPLRRG
jgi:hypothetical protein